MTIRVVHVEKSPGERDIVSKNRILAKILNEGTEAVLPIKIAILLSQSW